MEYPYPAIPSAAKSVVAMSVPTYEASMPIIKARKSFLFVKNASLASVEREDRAAAGRISYVRRQKCGRSSSGRDLYSRPKDLAPPFQRLSMTQGLKWSLYTLPSFSAMLVDAWAALFTSVKRGSMKTYGRG